MKQYTKSELLALPKEELTAHRKEAWQYYKKVNYVEEFQNLED